jgi:hypothetical protein
LGQPGQTGGLLEGAIANDEPQLRSNLVHGEIHMQGLKHTFQGAHPGIGKTVHEYVVLHINGDCLTHPGAKAFHDGVSLVNLETRLAEHGILQENLA